MLRNLIQTGNSKALILTKDMRDHLGVEDEVEVEFRRGSIVLRHPDVLDEDAQIAPKKPKVAKDRDGVLEETKVKDKDRSEKADKLKPAKTKEDSAKDGKVKAEKAKEKGKGKGKKGK